MENVIRSDATAREIAEAARELKEIIQLHCDNFQKKFLVFPDISTETVRFDSKAGFHETAKIKIKIYF